MSSCISRVSCRHRAAPAGASVARPRGLHVASAAPDTDQTGTEAASTGVSDPVQKSRDVEVPPEVLSMPWEVLAGISSAGLGLTGYLTWSKLNDVSVACSASGGGSCSTILESSYAEILGVPLPVLGAVGYASVAAISAYSLLLQSGSASGEPDAPTSRQLATNGKLVLYASSILAGTSTALAVTLKQHFPDSFCAYCTASILASLSIFTTAFSFSSRGDRVAGGGVTFAMCTALLALYSTYPDTTLARDIDLDYTMPVVTDASDAGSRDLAARLRAAGAKMYGAFWCSHCYEQKQLFGRDAVADLPYVECYPDGYHGVNSISKTCSDVDIQNFPTWIINGKTIEGDWPLKYLADVLDGADPKAEAKKYLE